MFLKRHSIALTAACAVAALLFAVMPADAARGGRGGYGGGRGGYGGGWGGYGGYGYGWGGYGYGRGIGLGIGIGGYPYYGGGYYDGGYYDSPNVIYTQPYYTTPSVTVTPSYNDNVIQAGYAEPAAPSDNRCRVEVRVPNESAQVMFDGDATHQTGMDRVFASPPLTPGKTYSYTVEAKWMENGKAMDQTRSVTVTPNQKAVVDFGR